VFAFWLRWLEECGQEGSGRSRDFEQIRKMVDWSLKSTEIEIGRAQDRLATAVGKCRSVQMSPFIQAEGRLCSLLSFAQRMRSSEGGNGAECLHFDGCGSEQVTGWRSCEVRYQT
jgi:hypothetical protein